MNEINNKSHSYQGIRCHISSLFILHCDIKQIQNLFASVSIKILVFMEIASIGWFSIVET